MRAGIVICLMWSTISLHEKLTVHQKVKKFTTLYKTKNLLLCLQQLLQLARQLQSTLFHSVSSTSILMLTSHLYPGLADDLFPPDFPTKILQIFPFFPICFTCQHPHDLINQLIWHRTQTTKFLITKCVMEPSISQTQWHWEAFEYHLHSAVNIDQNAPKLQHSKNLNSLVETLGWRFKHEMWGSHSSENWIFLECGTILLVRVETMFGTNLQGMSRK
jgi:hypothetical protein